MRARHILRSVVVGALALVLVAGCGDDEGGSEPSAARTAGDGTTYNDADVEFASEMIPHHAEALAMVDLTVGRELSPEVQALAAAIREAQAPEVEQMTDWLTAWGEPVPETALDHSNAHGHDGDADAAMEELEAAPDQEFERLFLEMMIEHHEGAVEMAASEQADGEYTAAVDLAGVIETSQTAEIETMRALLDS